MKTLLTAVAVAAIVGLPAFASVGSAQEYGNVHETHFLTFDVAMALPDGTMLPAGTFVFSWNPRDRLTRISSEDRSRVYATLLAFPVQRAMAKDEATQHDIIVTRASANAPPTLKAWFCPGNPIGHEFAAVTKAR